MQFLNNKSSFDMVDTKRIQKSVYIQFRVQFIKLLSFLCYFAYTMAKDKEKISDIWKQNQVIMNTIGFTV